MHDRISDLLEADGRLQDETDLAWLIDGRVPDILQCASGAMVDAGEAFHALGIRIAFQVAKEAQTREVRKTDVARTSTWYKENTLASLARRFMENLTGTHQDRSADLKKLGSGWWNLRRRDWPKASQRSSTWRRGNMMRRHEEA